MHAARLDRSPRLQRVHACLLDGAEHTTLEIAITAQTVCPGTCVSELRAQGAHIECRRLVGGSRATPVYVYRMTRSVPAGPEGTATVPACPPRRTA